MYNQGSKNLKEFKRLKCFKNSTGTVEFDYSDLNNLTGRSYRWQFFWKHKTTYIFNSYNWSVTTSGHQSAVRDVLRKRFAYIKFIELDLGQATSLSLELVEKSFAKMIRLEIEISTARKKDSYAQKNRIRKYDGLKENIETLESVDKSLKLSVKRMKEIVKQETDKFFEELNEKAQDQAFKKAVMKESMKTQLIEIENVDNLIA